MGLVIEIQRQLDKTIIHEKAEELADIDFIESNINIGGNDTITVKNISDYLENL